MRGGDRKHHPPHPRNSQTGQLGTHSGKQQRTWHQVKSKDPVLFSDLHKCTEEREKEWGSEEERGGGERGRRRNRDREE